MRANEREHAAVRSIEVAVDSSINDGRWLDWPAHLVVWLDRVRTEMEYRHGSIALAAAKRIARSHRLVKLPNRARWRSRPR